MTTVKLNVVLAESALELVPHAMWKSPPVAKDGARRGLEPSQILLDRSLHHSAMLRLADSHKRGRPDLVHVTLLDITGTPLYLDGKVKVFVQTYAGKVVELEERTRIPKNYLRFRGLMEKALSGDGGELIRVYHSTVAGLLRAIRPDIVVGLSVQGAPTTLPELGKRLAAREFPCAVIGGFPHGHFEPETLKAVGELARIDDRPLEAHVVAARLLYEVEKSAAND